MLKPISGTGLGLDGPLNASLLEAHHSHILMILVSYRFVGVQLVLNIVRVWGVEKTVSKIVKRAIS